MITRKQKSLFRKSLNKIYPYAIVTMEDGTIVNSTLYEFRNNRKTFKLGINPIEKDFKAYEKALKAERRRLRKPGRLRNAA